MIRKYPYTAGSVASRIAGGGGPGNGGGGGQGPNNGGPRGNGNGGGNNGNNGGGGKRLTYEETVLLDSPYAYWKLNASSGNEPDLGSGGNPLVPNSITQGAAGLRSNNQSWSSASGSGYGSVASSAGFVYTGDFGFECLLLLTSLPGSGVQRFFWSMGTTGETEATNVLGQWAFSNTGGVYEFAFFHENGAGVNNSVSIPHTLAISTVYHIFLQRNTTAKTYEAFVNGVSVGSVGYANNPTGGSSGLFYVSRLFSGSSGIIGRFSDVAIYKGLLNPGRIAAHSAAIT